MSLVLLLFAAACWATGFPWARRALAAYGRRMA
jgi:hypothetical protein